MQKTISSTSFRKQALTNNYRVTAKNARQILSIVYQFGWCSENLVIYLQDNIGKIFRQKLHSFIRGKFQSFQKLSLDQLVNFKLEQILDYLTKEECLQKTTALDIFHQILLNQDFQSNLEDYFKLPQQKSKLKHNLNQMINEIGINKQTINNNYFSAFKQNWIQKTKKIRIIPKNQVKSQISSQIPLGSPLKQAKSQKASQILPQIRSQISPQTQTSPQIRSQISPSTRSQILHETFHSNFFAYQSNDMKQSSVSFSDWDNDDEEIELRNPSFTYAPPKIEAYCNQIQRSTQQIWKKIQTIDLKSGFYYEKGYIITGFQNSGKSVCSFLMAGNWLQIKGEQLLQSNGKDLKQQKQFQTNINSKQIQIYECTEFQSNCMGVQKILINNYEKYCMLKKLKEIKFIITIKEDHLISKRQFLKTIILFFKNFKKIEKSVFCSISFLITESSLSLERIQDKIKELSRMTSYQEYGLNKIQKLFIGQLLEIVLKKKRIYNFPKIDLTQRRVKINSNIFYEIDSRCDYWINNNPSTNIHCKTLQDIMKLGSADVYNSVQKFLKGTNQLINKNIQSVSVFSEIVQDIKQKSNSSNSKFFKSLQSKRELYCFQGSFEHQRRQKTNQISNQKTRIPSSLPFWMRCLYILKNIELIICRFQDIPLTQTQQVIQTAEREIMELISLVFNICQNEIQLYKKFTYIFYRLFQNAKIFYKFTRSTQKRSYQIQSYYSFHIFIRQAVSTIMYQTYNQTRTKLLSNYVIQQSASLQQCKGVKDLFEQSLRQIESKNPSCTNIPKYKESIQKLEQIIANSKITQN